jgi:pimeloyl-ACP methyl ester carboxylesterase
MINLTSKTSVIGGELKTYQWHYQERNYSIVYETINPQKEGCCFLLLPAFSTVSSRTEMAQIAQVITQKRLGKVTIVDWLGFGASARPKLNYDPALYRHFLNNFITDNFTEKLTIITAGHSAAYVLDFAKDRPELVEKIVLIAPTWKGPLRAMGVPEPIARGIKNLIRLPSIGQILYYFNTTPSFLKLMYRRHVYVNAASLTPEFIAQKREVTQQKGARFAPAAFVTGGLDFVTNRNDFLSLIKTIKIPMLVIIAENAPPKSKAEMEAIDSLNLDNLQIVRLAGTLGMQEEYGGTIGQLILENS